jgi:type IV pilus assembly protein PilB
LSSSVSPGSRLDGQPAGQNSPPRLIGEILLQQSLITPAQLSKALDRHKRTRQPLGQVLVDMGFVTADLISRR